MINTAEIEVFVALGEGTRQPDTSTRSWPASGYFSATTGPAPTSSGSPQA